MSRSMLADGRRSGYCLTKFLTLQNPESTPLPVDVSLEFMCHGQHVARLLSLLVCLARRDFLGSRSWLYGGTRPRRWLGARSIQPLIVLRTLWQPRGVEQESCKIKTIHVDVFLDRFILVIAD